MQLPDLLRSLRDSLAVNSDQDEAEVNGLGKVVKARKLNTPRLIDMADNGAA
jgi:hypothetical protein